VPPGEQRAGRWTYLVCPRCASAWLDPIPQSSADLFGDGYFQGGIEGGYGDYEGDAHLHRRNGEERLARMQHTLGAGGEGFQVLDVGCAHGYFLDEAAAADWHTSGVEVSPAARAAAAARGHRVTAALDEQDGPFQAITFFQVLEHLPDPAGALRAAAGLLTEDGVVVIETWDRTSSTARLFGRAWQQINPPTVLHLFSQAGLRRLLQRTGFASTTIERTTKLVSVGLAAGVVVHRLGPLEGPATRLLQRPSVAGRAVRYPLDDLVTATARRQ
jgi:SAM-dependent methyltransferase